MFTTAERESLLNALTALAQADDGVAAAAVVGSGARGATDEFSDIDLVLRVAEGVDPGDVASRWTEAMYRDHGAAHHLDVLAGGVLYRVFLLASSLQVDVSFWPYEEFRATEAGFRLLFGEANPPTQPAPLDVERLVGYAWLYGLHARSAIARGRVWQAQMMLDDLRDQVLALACQGHGLNPHHGREVDRLPASFLTAVGAAAPGDLSAVEQRRSLALYLDLLAQEAQEHDPDLDVLLRPPLQILARTGRSRPAQNGTRSASPPPPDRSA